MRVRLDTCRPLVYRIGWLKDQNRSAVQEAAIAKLHVSEGFVQSSLDAVQVFGGYGYMTEQEIERDLRDAGGRRLRGMEHHLIALASRLPPSVRCLVCCLDASADYEARLTDARIEHANLDWPILLRPGGTFAYLRFERAVRRFRPHIVHSYGFAADVVAGLLRARGSNVRIITSRRGENPNWRHQAFRRLVNRVSAKVVCVSQETAAFVQSTESPRPGLLTVIPNGVAVDAAGGRVRARHTRGDTKDPQAKEREPVRFGTLGTVKPIKGTDLLVDAFMQFDPTAHVELLIAGLVDRPWAEALRERAPSGRADPVRRTFVAGEQLSLISGRLRAAVTIRGHVQRAARGHGLGPSLHCDRRRIEPLVVMPSGRAGGRADLRAECGVALPRDVRDGVERGGPPGLRGARRERWSAGATRFRTWCSNTNGCIDRSSGGRRMHPEIGQAPCATE